VIGPDVDGLKAINSLTAGAHGFGEATFLGKPLKLHIFVI
jgi:hypothetical protein